MAGEAVMLAFTIILTVGGDRFIRFCPGSDYDPKCRCSRYRTFYSPHFHHDQLHDVLQFPRGELSSGLLHSPAAY